MTNTSIIGNFPKNKTAGNLTLVKKMQKLVIERVPSTS